jgi:hypothetical protein
MIITNNSNIIKMRIAKGTLLIIIISGTLACSTVKFTEKSISDEQRKAFFPRSEIKPALIPEKEKIWVFVMAGQSNMAGRGLVEPKDTIPSERILTINRHGEIVIAKEPLHFYEPELTGLDCGMSFARTIIANAPSDVSVLMLPVAVGGSSISQWLGDSLYRNVKLLTNFREKTEIGQQYGNIKAILWHQGESDANSRDLPLYSERIATLTAIFRDIAGDNNLPVLLGELGSYSADPENWEGINLQIRKYSATDPLSAVIGTSDLKEKGDKIHFNSRSQRKMGRRFAEGFLEITK